VVACGSHKPYGRRFESYPCNRRVYPMYRGGAGVCGSRRSAFFFETGFSAYFKKLKGELLKRELLQLFFLCLKPTY
jgi:hypothetical protein